MTLKATLTAMGYGVSTPSTIDGNRGNFGNRRKINDLAVAKLDNRWQPTATANPLKSLRLPRLPKLPCENQEVEVRLEPRPWWRDPEAIEARRDEVAGWLEFDEGMVRDDAERRARELVEIEVKAMVAAEGQPRIDAAPLR